MPGPSPSPPSAPAPAPPIEAAPEAPRAPPPPGPGPASASTPPLPDRTAPLLQVTAKPTRSLRDLVRRRGVRTAVRCSEACRVRAELTLPADAARRLGFGRVTRPVVLARTTVTRPGAGSFARNLRLSATEGRRLGRTRSVRLHVRVRAEDPARNAHNRLTRLELRR